jgi:hypothetical protein
MANLQQAPLVAQPQCPCGLPYEDVRDLRLIGAGGVCTAFRKGSRTEVCGELLADHPHTQAVPAPGIGGTLLVSEDEDALEMREYILYNIRDEIPVGLIPSGIREYISQQLKGVSIEGTIKRHCSVKYAQHIIVNLTGAVRDLQTFEDDALGSAYWTWKTVFTQRRRSFENHQVVILNSTVRDVETGKNSDGKYEVFSVHGSDKGSKKSG